MARLLHIVARIHFVLAEKLGEDGGSDEVERSGGGGGGGGRGGGGRAGSVIRVRVRVRLSDVEIWIHEGRREEGGT